MFADSSVLERKERAELGRELRECVKANPQVSDLRVLFGMALCVNFEVPDAIEELREGVRLAPDSFIARLKMGELWMRLRVMDKAEEHTTARPYVGLGIACRAESGGKARRLQLPRHEACRNRAGRIQESVDYSDAGCTPVAQARI